MQEERRCDSQPTPITGVDYRALGLAALRRWPRGLREALRREGHWEDLLQTVALSAWQARVEGLGPGEAAALCRRNLRGTLQALGWRVEGGRLVRAERPVGRVGV